MRRVLIKNFKSFARRYVLSLLELFGPALLCLIFVWCGNQFKLVGNVVGYRGETSKYLLSIEEIRFHVSTTRIIYYPNNTKTDEFMENVGSFFRMEYDCKCLKI
jgi:hypothetical protein